MALQINLLKAGVLAAAADESYKDELAVIEQRHIEAVKVLVPVAKQSSILSWVKQRCNEIEDICNGVFLLENYLTVPATAS